MVDLGNLFALAKMVNGLDTVVDSSRAPRSDFTYPVRAEPRGSNP